MRPVMAIALGIVAVLIATSLFVPGFARAGAPGAAQGALPLVSSVTVATTDNYGISQTSFESGLSTGQVFFTVTDAMGATDGNATVKIFDHNATRDGVPTPAATYSVHVATGANYSYEWNIFYHIPLGLVFGGQWNITVQATAGGFAFQNFTVHTFVNEGILTPRDVLPAENVSALSLVYFYANDAPYRNVSSVVVTGTYSTTSGTAKLPTVHLGALAVGYDNFTVPSNAVGSFTLDFFANTTSASFNTSSIASASGYVGNLTTPSISLGRCPSGCPTSVFAAGTPVYVTVTELISGTGEPSRGMTASFKFEKGASFVTPPGSVPSSVLTNQQGQASISFLASTSVFSLTGTNSVEVTVTDPTDLALGSLSQSHSFTIYNPTLTPGITLAWSSSEYYSGALATAHWTLGGQNSTVLTGWSGSFWFVQSTSGPGIYQVGSIAPGTTSGSFNLAIPDTFTGTLLADVIASNATSEVVASSYTSVEADALELSPSEDTYLPGDTIHIAVSTEGPALTGATLWATVVDGSGNWIQNAAVSGNSLTISVPSNAPPTAYVVTVVAQTPTGGDVANASVTVTEASGVNLNLGISTASNYLDGSYQPGETVTVSYTFTTYGVATLPQTYVLTLSPNAGYTTTTVDLSSASGSFQYTIPKDAPNGLLAVEVHAALGGSNCVSYCSASSDFTASVNGNPAPLSYQFGNSGFSLGGLILVVVLILLALIVFFVLRRRGGMGGKTMMMKPEPASMSGTGSSSPSTGSSGSSGSGSSGTPPAQP
jgi:hypothetical protein